MADKEKKFQVGIIGGGQLARMLLLKAHELGISAAVLSGHDTDPAAQVTSNWFKAGKPGEADKKSLSDFLKKIETLTYESEFVLASELEPLLKKHEVNSFPLTEHMTLFQQRWSQKSWLDESGIATSKWIQGSEIKDWDHLKAELGTQKVVIKKNMGGYDGYGTFLVSSEEEYLQVVQKLKKAKATFIAEAFVRFRKELAMTFGRSVSGQIAKFPLVETFQTDSRCDWVKGPIDDTDYRIFLKKVEKGLQKLKYVGVIAFELFETKDGSLLVNEVAPRVHNSSHYSLDGFNIDQFSMHLKAITDNTLMTPRCFTDGFAMKNLIGTGVESIRLTSSKDARLHWYGKSENRKGRKMGHLNAAASSPERALQLVRAAEKEMRV
jgi:5-(carboxyamino)imidazole ribonucleotide synthase